MDATPASPFAAMTSAQPFGIGLFSAPTATTTDVMSELSDIDGHDRERFSSLNGLHSRFYLLTAD